MVIAGNLKYWLNPNYNAAVFQGVKQTGHEAVTKTWVTMKDDRVRETHDYLEGTTVHYDCEFFTYDGDHSQYPGGFSKPENNVNCRCILLYKKQ